MTLRLPLSFVPLFWLWVMQSFAFGQNHFFREIYDDKSGSFVEVESLFSKLPSSGYLPVRVTIQNRTENATGISLSCESTSGSSYYYRGNDNGSLKTQSSFRVNANAKETKTVDLLVPVSSMIFDNYYKSGGNLKISASGTVNQSNSIASSGGKSAPQVLLSKSLFEVHSSILDTELVSYLGSSSSYGRSSIDFAGKFTPSQMPEDWRGYAGYDHMILQDADWAQMSPGARSAIQKWVKMGGKVRIFAAQPTAVLTSLKLDDSPNTQVKSGMGSYFVDGKKLSPKNLVKWVFDSSSGDRHFASQLTSDYSTSGWGLQGMLKEKTFNYSLFIVVLIVFGILVGPVNLFIFAKAGQRHKLFVTTPLISLGASILMIGLIFLQDGVGGNGYRVQHVHLDADGEDNNAYVHQEQICRTGVLFGKRFEVTEAAAMSVVPLAETPWTRVFDDMKNGQRYTTEMTEKGFTSSGDWLQSRSEQAQVLRAVIPSRARIEARREDAGYSMQSYFEYELTEFSFLDQDGKYWKAVNVIPGKNFRCVESTMAEHRAVAMRTAKLLGDGAQQKLMDKIDEAGSFVAVSTQAPMVETFGNVRWKDNMSIITGTVREIQP